MDRRSLAVFMAMWALFGVSPARPDAAANPPNQTTPEPGARRRPVERAPFALLRDGGQLPGTLQGGVLAVRTPYGTLNVPAAQISSLSLCPVDRDEGSRLADLARRRIPLLGSSDFRVREEAHAWLARLGSLVLEELRAHREDPDLEVRSRVADLVAAASGTEREVPCDWVSGRGFSIRGWIEAPTLALTPEEKGKGTEIPLRQVRRYQGPRMPLKIAPAPATEGKILTLTFTDGTSVPGSIDPERLQIETAAGPRQIPVGRIETLEVNVKDGLARLKTGDGTLEGTLAAGSFTLTTGFGTLRFAAADLTRLAHLPAAGVGTVLRQGHRIVAVKRLRGRTYAVVRAAQEEEGEGGGGMDWEAAISVAKELGGHLATVADQEENDFIVSLLPAGAFWFWIGYSDAGAGAAGAGKEKEWRWVTGEKRGFENWAAGEPDGAGEAPGAGEDFAVISAAAGSGLGRWHDAAGDRLQAGCVVEIER